MAQIPPRRYLVVSRAERHQPPLTPLRGGAEDVAGLGPTVVGRRRGRPYLCGGMHWGSITVGRPRRSMEDTQSGSATDAFRHRVWWDARLIDPSGPAKACVRSVRGPHPNGPASCLERHGRRCPRLIERGDGDAAMSCPKRRRRAFVLPLVDRRGLLTLPNASGPLLFGGAVSLRSEERLVLRATLGIAPIDNDKNEVGIGVGLGWGWR